MEAVKLRPERLVKGPADTLGCARSGEEFMLQTLVTRVVFKSHPLVLTKPREVS